MRSQIFIGSSVEGLKYVDRIKSILEPVGDCISWTTSFTQNKSALDSLIKKTKLSEFAILIATNDDVTLKRDELKSTPRDNIVFEFGLFIGATGIDRAFLLVEEGTDLPSDLEGITVGRFSNDSAKHDYLDTVCKGMAEQIAKIEKTSQLGLLPSTALAIGYFNSFIMGVCKHLRDEPKIMAGTEELKIRQFEMHIIIPHKLDASGVNDFKYAFNKARELESARTIVTNAMGRDYPFHFKIDPQEQDRTGEVEVKLFDIPTTLNTIAESIKLFMPLHTIGEDADRDYLEGRELENFCKVLKFLISQHVLTSNNVFVIDNVVI